MKRIAPPISITGLGALSGLGSGVDAHCQSITRAVRPFRPLGELLGAGSPHAELPAAWIADRRQLTHRKWSPASMAALIVARQAIDAAGWTAADLRGAALVLGTSRGNAAGWLGPWPGRRPFAVMAASNTIHSEPATAASIEFGITGPNHVVASGCAAGLDALGIAWMMLRCGQATRALVLAVDLPLVPLLLDNYASSGLLARCFQPDPYHPASRGFIPAEGAAAMTLEIGPSSHPGLRGYDCNADAADPVGMPADGGLTADLAQSHLTTHGPVIAVCPHATGTAVQAAADPAWLSRVFPHHPPTLHLLKPFTGHTIGASGLLESVILSHFLSQGLLPPNIAGLHAPPGFSLPSSALPATGAMMKVSHGMGGHNAIVSITPP